jgi:3-methylfumaryl-CoA hydratase
LSEEHYPGLVVHAPLLATLLLDSLHRAAPLDQVQSFRFRAVRPAFDGQPIGLRGKREGKNIELWTTDKQGFTGMTASAVLA